MCAWIVPPVEGLVELNVAPEIVADAVGAIALHNGRVTIYLYEEQMPLEAGANEPMRVVTGKITGEIGNVPGAIGTLAMCLVRRRAPGIVPAGGTPLGPRLVRS